MRWQRSSPLIPALLIPAALVLGGCGAADPEHAHVATPERVRAHTEFLAHDLLEGREAGTRGYDLAARYVASQFAQLGLEPGGDNGGWLQRVPLLRGERLRDGALLSAHAADGSTRAIFEFESEFLPGVDYDRAEWSLQAPMVFVGQGVHAPEFGHDDFAGVDLNGKIALMFSGAPARFPNDPRAYYASSRQKLEALVARGAVGVIYLGDPEQEAKSPWARGAANWARPGMRRLDTDGKPVDTFPELRGSASVSSAAVENLFADAPQPASELFERLKQGTLTAFDLPGSIHMAGRSVHTPTSSDNVVALQRGHDTRLAREHIVFTAHLDHLGTGAAVNGDAIYNGAVDNALGTALLLETARLAASAPPTRRSRVFVALTAEEKGLLGAEHFAATPGIDGELVANINIDMPVILGPQNDVITIGIEHSDLRAVVERAAQELGIGLSPDPFPEEVVFVRSDQYAFIRRGVPAVYLDGGLHSTVPGVSGKEQLDGFLRQHYHQPSDQTDLPIHYPSAARLADLNHRIGVIVGDQAQRPRWNAGDFFGERFAPGQAFAP